MVACVQQVAIKFTAMSDAVVGISTSSLEHLVREEVKTVSDGLKQTNSSIEDIKEILRAHARH